MDFFSSPERVDSNPHCCTLFLKHDYSEHNCIDIFFISLGPSGVPVRLFESQCSVYRPTQVTWHVSLCLLFTANHFCHVAVIPFFNRSFSFVNKSSTHTTKKKKKESLQSFLGLWQHALSSNLTAMLSKKKNKNGCIVFTGCRQTHKRYSSICQPEIVFFCHHLILVSWVGEFYINSQELCYCFQMTIGVNSSELLWSDKVLDVKFKR